MPLSAASILHAFLLTLLLGAAATASSVPDGNGDVNSSLFTNGTGTSPNADATERYICYLCTGRNPLLIRYCPIYWDECHLVCYADDAPAATSAAPVPTTSLGSAAASANPSGVHDDECYVMKLYRNGSYTIVTRLACARIATCLLSCGGGDMADSDRKALGSETSAVPATTAAVQGSLTPRLADFQRCGTQVTATPSLRGTVVRAGGARRRR
jgi:anaphase-promoting complex subunit 6